jgi:hypothetical protein
MFLGQGSRQQADFFAHHGAYLGSPLHNFTNCPKQATAQTNGQWCHDNSAHKLSVALVTGFVIFVGVSESLATPEHILVDLEDIQVGQYLEQAR